MGAVGVTRSGPAQMVASGRITVVCQVLGDGVERVEMVRSLNPAWGEVDSTSSTCPSPRNGELQRHLPECTFALNTLGDPPKRSGWCDGKSIAARGNSTASALLRCVSTSELCRGLGRKDKEKGKKKALGTGNCGVPLWSRLDKRFPMQLAAWAGVERT